MKKVLIISYFFPPCNLTAANRIGSWEKYMPKHGFYPIVITRNWTGNELTEQQRLTKSGQSVKHVQKENAEIYYLPYKPSLRDKLFVNAENSKFASSLSKLFTFSLLIAQNFTLKAIPYRNLYYKARTILINDSSIETLIISGNPFEQFYFGYLLKKEFPDIKWIADYRDEWTTSEINEFGFLRNGVNNIHKYFEKKWLAKTNLITANTNYATNKLATFHIKTVKRLLNGFDEFEYTENKVKRDNNELIIVHNGSLYPTQKLNLLKEGLSKVEIPDNFKIILKFPGIKIKKDIAAKVSILFSDINVDVQLTERLPREEVMAMQLEADVLLMVAHEGKKGIVGSKLYEYLSLKKPVLLCPTDNDELEETLNDSGLGIIISNKKDLINALTKLINKKRTKGIIEAIPNNKIIDTFARKEQVKLLTDYINQLK